MMDLFYLGVPVSHEGVTVNQYEKHQEQDWGEKGNTRINSRGREQGLISGCLCTQSRFFFYQDPETEAAKSNLANTDFSIYTCAFHTVACQNETSVENLQKPAHLNTKGNLHCLCCCLLIPCCKT